MIVLSRALQLPKSRLEMEAPEDFGDVTTTHADTAKTSATTKCRTHKEQRRNLQPNNSSLEEQTSTGIRLNLKDCAREVASKRVPCIGRRGPRIDILNYVRAASEQDFDK